MDLLRLCPHESLFKRSNPQIPLQNPGGSSGLWLKDGLSGNRPDVLEPELIRSRTMAAKEEKRIPVAPHVAPPDPEDSISSRQSQPFGNQAPQHGKLLSQGNVFLREGLEHGGEGAEHEVREAGGRSRRLESS